MDNPNQPETEDVDKPEAAEPDTESDPGLDDGSSAEWAGEGGATAEGPATDD